MDKRDGPMELAGATASPAALADGDELTRSLKALRVSEARYRRLFEAAQDGILLLNADTAQIEDVNPYLIKLLGYSHEQLLGKKLWEIGCFQDTAISKEAFAELQERHYIRYENMPLRTEDGKVIAVEFVSSVYDCEGIPVIQCNIRDNTKRHLAELALKAAARALQLLSESNSALLGSKTEDLMLAEFCRIAVETGGYRLASVGVAEDGPDKRVRLIAHFGYGDGFVASAQLDWGESKPGSGPTGRALRTGEAQVSEDIAADDSTLLWRDEALKRGLRSVIALPFPLPDGTRACLTLYGAMPDQWSSPERKLLKEIASDLAFGINALRTEVARVKYQLAVREGLERTIQVIAGTIDQRDSYTAGHQRRVAGICVQIATELGLDDERIHGLRLAALIHDLGKISVPAEILAKPRGLTPVEFLLIKQHAQNGFDIVKDVVFPWPIAQMILQHHERLDGSGYPLGLKGDAILLEARILAVADVVEAMSSHRPYRAALGVDAALKEIAAQSGVQLDSQVVDACVRVFRERGFALES
jgi:PAS domain S-box-containing protein